MIKNILLFTARCLYRIASVSGGSPSPLNRFEPSFPMELYDKLFKQSEKVN